MKMLAKWRLLLPGECVLLLALAGTAAAQAPTISSISPSSATAGGPGFTLSVSGSGFLAPVLLVPGSVVRWNGASLATQFVSSSQLTATVTSNLISAPGTASVTVANPGGLTSNSATFTINPALTITTASLPDGSVGVAYSQGLSASGGSPPYSWTISSGSLPPGLALAPSGSLSGTPTTAGTFNFTVQVRDSGQVTASKAFVLNITQPVTITTASPLPAGTVGTAYSATLAASGGSAPYSWAVIGGSLPPGLTLAASGSISGTPTQAGTFNFTAQVTDSAQATASKAFAVTINPEANPLTITTTSPLPAGTVGVAYSQTLSASGGRAPYSWAVIGGSLPPGLTLASSGSISGTPTQAGTFNFTAQVSDSAQATASKALAVTISPPEPTPPTITTASPLAEGTVGAAYSQTLSAAGGSAPYSWVVIGGSLPPGLTLAASGSISGTPTQAGTFNFTAQVTDSAQATASKPFALTISAPSSAPPTITTASSFPDGTVGTAYSQTLSASGGTPPYSWSVIGGSLPPGLTLAPSGSISGTPTQAGTFTFTVQVTDSAQANSSKPFTTRINSAPGPTPAPQLLIDGMSDTLSPAQQIRVDLHLAAQDPRTITGEITLAFTPDAVMPADDPAVQFSTGGRTARFTIPANTTQAQFTAPELRLQTGTVAGTIALTVRVQADGSDVTPSPAPQRSSRIPRSAPAVSNVRITRTASGFEVQVTGFSAPREVSEATFRFTPAAGANLQTTELTVSLSALFTRWYQDAASAQFGSQFTLVQPFTVQGDASAIRSVSVTLRNSQGTSSPAGSDF